MKYREFETTKSGTVKMIQIWFFGWRTFHEEIV